MRGLKKPHVLMEFLIIYSKKSLVKLIFFIVDVDNIQNPQVKRFRVRLFLSGERQNCTVHRKNAKIK